MISGRTVLIGDSNVGKTCLLNQLIEHRFSKDEVQTVGANFQVFIVEIGGTRVELNLWDTAGQCKYRALCPIYYKGAVASVAVFDATDRASYDNLEGWISDFQGIVGGSGIVVICANKIDKEASIVPGLINEAKEWAEARGYLFAATSAMTGAGVARLFTDLAARILEYARPAAVGGVQLRDNAQRGCC